jgi:uncharacterized membrane protein
MNEQMNNNGQIPYDDTKLMSALAYIFFFVPLIAGAYKTSEYSKFHVNQGVALWLTAIAYSIAYSIFTAIFVWIPFIGPVLVGLVGLAALAFPVFAIIGVVNAVKGEMKEIPIIGKYRVIK